MHVSIITVYHIPRGWDSLPRVGYHSRFPNAAGWSVGVMTPSAGGASAGREEDLEGLTLIGPDGTEIPSGQGGGGPDQHRTAGGGLSHANHPPSRRLPLQPPGASGALSYAHEHDVEKGGRFDARSACIILWSHH